MRKITAFIGVLALAVLPAHAQFMTGGGFGGGGGGGGGVTSFSYNCPTTGPLTGAVTLPNGIGEIPETTSFVPTAAQCGAMFTSTGGAGATLPTIGVGGGDVENPYYVIIKNADTASNSMTVSGGGTNVNYNGASSASITLSAGQSALFLVNAANNLWQATSTTSTPQLTGPGYQPTVYYLPSGNTSFSGTGNTITASTIYCGAGWINNISPSGGGSATLGDLLVRITTIGTTTDTLALYADDTTVSPHRPGALIANTATFANTSTGAMVEAASGTVPGPGMYWFCGASGDATQKWATKSGATSDPSNNFWVGTTTLGFILDNSAMPSGVSTPMGTYGTWPASLHGSTWTEQALTIPVMGFEFASIP